MRSSSWQGPFFLSNFSGQEGHNFSDVPVPGRGLFFSAIYLGKKGIISRTFQFLAGAFFFSATYLGKKGHDLSYVPFPGRGLLFSATYRGKKGIISRTFQFLPGAFFLSH